MQPQAIPEVVFFKEAFMKKIFIQGLVTLAPIVITIAIVVWLYDLLEAIFGAPLKAILGDKRYVQGLGLILALVTIFLVGILVNTWIVRKLHNLWDKIVARIPIVKTIYNAIFDLMKFFKGDKQLQAANVVAFTVGDIRMLGLVTREDFQDLSKDISKKGEVAVFLPMSYQIGGYMVLIPKEKLEPLPIPVEEAMRFIMTAGLLSSRKEGQAGS